MIVLLLPYWHEPPQRCIDLIQNARAEHTPKRQLKFEFRTTVNRLSEYQRQLVWPDVEAASFIPASHEHLVKQRVQLDGVKGVCDAISLF